MIEVKAYAGLIRNHRELAEELGIDIAGCTRMEREERLIVAAYEKWGEMAGAHINGQFGFALEDSETGEVFCSRDILGAELFFYYVTEDGRLLYGNEIKDLFGQPGFKRELNRELIQFFLGFTYVPGEETLFKGIMKLAPGEWLRANADGIERGRFWELSFEPDETKTLDEWADAISDAMDASMNDIVDEDETPDSFLSGGVDSSYILAKGRARRGFCAAYENQDASEENEARATAEHLGRGFEAITITPEDFFATVDEFLLAYEQPQADVAGLALYVAAKQVKDISPLCFSGEGADEFFAGYGVYRNAGKKRPGQSSTYLGSTYIMNDSEQSRYLKRRYENRSAEAFMAERSKGAAGYDPLAQMLYAELLSYFEASILFNSTKITRGTGLDIRMPFCDLRMFDIARRMPSRFKLDDANNKVALRRAASRVLPQEVAYRKKLGFPVPVRAWLKDTKLNGDIQRAFESKAAAEFFDLDEIGALLDAFLGKKPRKNHRLWFKTHQAIMWRHVWTIYVFIRWYELFFGEDAAV